MGLVLTVFISFMVILGCLEPRALLLYTGYKSENRSCQVVMTFSCGNLSFLVMLQHLETACNLMWFEVLLLVQDYWLFPFCLLLGLAAGFLSKVKQVLYCNKLCWYYKFPMVIFKMSVFVSFLDGDLPLCFSIVFGALYMMILVRWVRPLNKHGTHQRKTSCNILSHGRDHELGTRTNYFLLPCIPFHGHVDCGTFDSTHALKSRN